MGVYGAMNYRVCLWSTSFFEGSLKRPFYLRCDFVLCQLCFPAFNSSFTDHSPSVTSKPLHCHIASWISGLLPNSLSFHLCFGKLFRTSISEVRSKTVAFLVYSLPVKTTVLHASLTASLEK
jgi:hypothetical protein